MTLQIVSLFPPLFPLLLSTKLRIFVLKRSLFPVTNIRFLFTPETMILTPDPDLTPSLHLYHCRNKHIKSFAPPPANDFCITEAKKESRRLPPPADGLRVDLLDDLNELHSCYSLSGNPSRTVPPIRDISPRNHKEKSDSVEPLG